MGSIQPMPEESFTLSDELLTSAQVAAMAGKTVATVARWAIAGLIPTAAQANGRVFRRSDVEAFLATRKTPAAS